MDITFTVMFSEISQVCKVLIKLTPKDYITDLALPPEFIEEAAGAAADVTIEQSISFIMQISKH
jgi:hypothetical protein